MSAWTLRYAMLVCCRSVPPVGQDVGQDHDSDSLSIPERSLDVQPQNRIPKSKRKKAKQTQVAPKEDSESIASMDVSMTFSIFNHNIFFYF